MRTINYSEFRSNLKANLDQVSDDHEILILHRSAGRSVVIMSIDEYNSFKETQYLLGTSANREKLEQAITDVEKGEVMDYPGLIEK